MYEIAEVLAAVGGDRNSILKISSRQLKSLGSQLASSTRRLASGVMNMSLFTQHPMHQLVAKSSRMLCILEVVHQAPHKVLIALMVM